MGKKGILFLTLTAVVAVAALMYTNRHRAQAQPVIADPEPEFPDEEIG